MPALAYASGPCMVGASGVLTLTRWLSSKCCARARILLQSPSLCGAGFQPAIFCRQVENLPHDRFACEDCQERSLSRLFRELNIPSGEADATRKSIGTPGGNS